MKNDFELRYLKKFVFNKTIYFISIFFERSIQFALLPVYTNYLSSSEYGIFAVAMSALTFLSFISTLGSENGLYKYNRESQFQENAAFNSAAICIINSFFLATILFALKDYFVKILFLDEKYIYVAIAILICLVLDSLTKAALLNFISLEKSKLYAVLSFVKGVANTLAVFYFVIYLKKGLYGAIISSLLVSLIAAFASGIIILKNFSLKKIDLKLISNLIQYGFPLALVSISLTLINFIDRYILQFYHGSSETGIYAASYKIAISLSYFSSSFSMSILPQAFELKKRNSNYKDYVKKGAIKSFYFLIFFSFLIIALAKPIAKIKVFRKHLIHPDYWIGLELLPWIIVGYIFYFLYVKYSIFYYVEDKTWKLSIYTFIASILSIFFYFIFIPSFKSLGAAIASCLSFFVLAFLIYVNAPKVNRLV